MIQRCEQLYESLLKDVDACRQNHHSLKEQIEQSFLICNQYVAIVNLELASYSFPTTSDEIYFFRCVKPKFTSGVKYYGFRYHAALFITAVYDPVKIKQFWTREASRLEKFISGHPDFYKYYKSGRTDKDVQLFTRINLTLSAKNEPEHKVVTNYDPLVSALLALERYHEYVQEELEKSG